MLEMLKSSVDNANGMNTATLIVAAIVAIVLVVALYGCYKTMSSKKCCSSGKGTCECDAPAHCSVKKQN